MHFKSMLFKSQLYLGVGTFLICYFKGLACFNIFKETSVLQYDNYHYLKHMLLLSTFIDFTSYEKHSVSSTDSGSG